MDSEGQNAIDSLISYMIRLVSFYANDIIDEATFQDQWTQLGMIIDESKKQVNSQFHSLGVDLQKIYKEGLNDKGK